MADVQWLPQSEFWPGVDTEKLPETAKKVVPIIAPNMAATVATNLGPDPNLAKSIGDPTGISSYIPLTGAAEGLAGFAGTAYDLARSGANMIYNLNLPPPPQWMTSAGEHWGNTQQDIASQLPHYQPTPEEAASPEYQHMVGMSTIAGNAVPVVPGSLLSSLPKAVSIPLSLAAPSTKMPLKDMFVAGATGPVLSTVLDAKDAQAAQPQPGGAQWLDQQSTAPQDSGGVQWLDSSSPDASQGTQAPTFNQTGQRGYTWGEVAGGLAAIVGGLLVAKYSHGLGEHITAVSRDERMNDPAYAQKSADYNNEQIAVQAGQQISNAEGGRTMPPRPTDGPGATAITAAKTQVFDANALGNDFIKLTSDTPGSYERLMHQFNNTYDPGVQQSSIREFLLTGKDPVSGAAIEPPARLYKKIDALTDTAQKVLNDGLNAANEMDNRNKGYRDGNTNPAHDFANVSDQDLVAYTQRMLADPVLNDIAHQYWATGKGMADIMLSRNFITQNDYNNIIRDHPNYVPEVDLYGRVTHALGPRNNTPHSGIDQVNTTAWSAMAQHIEAVHEQMARNDFLTAMTDHRLDVQNTYPNSAQSLREVPNPYPQAGQTIYATAGPHGALVRDPIYSVRRNTGIKFYRDDDPVLFDQFTGNAHGRAKMAFDNIGTLRRVQQMGTTGIVSALTGRAFPLTHNLRVAIQAPINRAAGTAGGLMDLAAQRATGGRVGYRWLDPTNLAGGAYSYARNRFDNFALHASNFFDPTNPNPIVQRIKSFMTPAEQKALSDKAMNYYLSTTTHQMQAGGATAMGIPYQTRLPAFSRVGTPEGAQQTIRLASGALAPGLFKQSGISLPGGIIIPTGKTGAIRATMFRVGRAVEQEYGRLMDAQQQYYYRLNKFRGDVDPGKLTYETRRIVGNPTTYGTNPLVGGLRQIVPYSNISLQGKARIGRALAEAPIGTSGAMIGSLAGLAMASIFTAMRNPQTLNYLQNMISTDQLASDVHIFGNEDPELHTTIPLLHDIRMPYAFVLGGISKILNIAAANHDPEIYDKVYSMMKEFFGAHVENTIDEAALHGLAQSMNVLDVPGWINGILALHDGGGSFRVDLERIVNDYRSGQLGRNTFTIPAGQDNPLPNHPVGDNLFEGTQAKVWKTVLTDFIGSAGALFDQASGMSNYIHKGMSFVDAAGQVGKDWLQKAMDENPALNNVLWENPARESMRPPIVEKVERELQLMKVASGNKNQLRMEGTTGGKFPLPVTQQPEGDFKLPKDPAMLDIYNTVGSNYQWITSHFMNEIAQMKKQMQDASQQPMDNEERRRWMNNQTRVIADKYRYIETMIHDMNASLSAKYGRSINATGNVDWKKSFDENFPPPN